MTECCNVFFFHLNHTFKEILPAINSNFSFNYQHSRPYQSTSWFRIFPYHFTLFELSQQPLTSSKADILYLIIRNRKKSVRVTVKLQRCLHLKTKNQNTTIPDGYMPNENNKAMHCQRFCNFFVRKHFVEKVTTSALRFSKKNFTQREYINFKGRNSSQTYDADNKQYDFPKQDKSKLLYMSLEGKRFKE